MPTGDYSNYGYQGTSTPYDNNLPAQQPAQQSPCPACGHCPCCGRGGYQQNPAYQPYPPYWVWYTSQSGNMQSSGPNQSDVSEPTVK